MEERKNLPTETPEKKENWFKRNLWLIDLVLIVVILLVGYYVYSNVEEIKLLEGDVCKLCMLKTNSTCFPTGSINIKQAVTEPINWSSFMK